MRMHAVTISAQMLMLTIQHRLVTMLKQAQKMLHGFTDTHYNPQKWLAFTLHDRLIPSLVALHHWVDVHSCYSCQNL